MLRQCLLSLLIFIATTTLAFADASFAHRPDVQRFIQMMVNKHGFKKSQLVALFTAVKVRPQVMRHVNKPLEKESWKTYQRLFVTEWNTQHGVAFWHKYESALHRAEQTYGVPASIIVATIGVETKYGKDTGEFRVIDSLSSIAFSSSKRAKFFRSELTEFLLLTREQHVNPLKMMGSYAGAIGQPQFMPSSYRYYAVNFSKSGTTDLMYNEVDVIGSIANYYKEHGWNTDEPVAIPAVMIDSRYDYLTRKHTFNKSMSLKELAKYGIFPRRPISDDNLKVRIIELQSHYSREYWLGFHNFQVIKRYNPSDLYAMAVYQVASHIAAAKGTTH